jgi:hypothetical protein
MKIQSEMEDFNVNTAYLIPPSTDVHDVFTIILKVKLILPSSPDATTAHFDIQNFVEN